MNIRLLFREIDKWQEEQIITDEQAAIIKSRYSDSKNKLSPALISAAAGVIFICAGIFSLIIALWKYIPQDIKSLLSFAPLIIVFIITAIYILTERKSVTASEIISLLYSAGIIISYKLTEYQYSVPSDHMRFIFICGIMILPLAFILRSTVASSVFIVCIFNWSFLAVSQDHGFFFTFFVFVFSLVSVSAAAIYIIKLNKLRLLPLRIIAYWLSAAAFFVLGILFNNILLGDTALVLLLQFGVLYMCGKKDSEIFSPFIAAGTAGTFTMLLLYSTGSISSVPEDSGILKSCFPVILFISMTVIYFSNREKDLKKTAILINSAAILVLSLIASFFTDNDSLPAWAVIITSLTFLFTGIINITAGIKNSKLTDINLGIIALFAVLFTLIEKSVNSIEKGIFIIFLGVILIIANIILNKKTKKHTEKKVDSVEK